jgi:hypothetical protein
MNLTIQSDNEMASDSQLIASFLYDRDRMSCVMDRLVVSLKNNPDDQVGRDNLGLMMGLMSLLNSALGDIATQHHFLFYFAGVDVVSPEQLAGLKKYLITLDDELGNPVLFEIQDQSEATGD